MHKFRGVGGGEFFISGFGESAEKGVFAIFRDAHGRETGGSGYYWKDQDSKSGNAPLTSVNIEVFDRNGGKLLYQRHLQIADRIPDELLDDLRRDRKGSLRIKVRLHRDGVLLGWDIERRPGYDRNKRDIYGEAAYVGPVWTKTGGDFKEARFLSWVESANGTLVNAPDRTSLAGGLTPELAARGIRLRNGYLWEPGWYIHPKTGQRIETDF